MSLVVKSYFFKKAENLATKQDVEAITKKIESVKTEYAYQLESTKAILTSQINRHSFRYEKEYIILEELTEALINLRNNTLLLRPQFDAKDPIKKEVDIKRERLNDFSESLKSLITLNEKKQPFLPYDIYRSIESVYVASHKEASGYAWSDPSKDNNYWEKAAKNREEIIEKTQLAIEKIKQRIINWES